jgi:hypothetical protein
MTIVQNKIHVEMESWTWRNWAVSPVLFWQLERENPKIIHREKW